MVERSLSSDNLSLITSSELIRRLFPCLIGNLTSFSPFKNKCRGTRSISQEKDCSKDASPGISCPLQAYSLSFSYLRFSFTISDHTTKGKRNSFDHYEEGQEKALDPTGNVSVLHPLDHGWSSSFSPAQDLQLPLCEAAQLPSCLV